MKTKGARKMEIERQKSASLTSRMLKCSASQALISSSSLARGHITFNEGLAAWDFVTRTQLEKKSIKCEGKKVGSEHGQNWTYFSFHFVNLFGPNITSLSLPMQLHSLRIGPSIREPSGAHFFLPFPIFFRPLKPEAERIERAHDEAGGGSSGRNFRFEIHFYWNLSLRERYCEAFPAPVHAHNTRLW